MSGRELIIYILKNGLEDEQVIVDGKFLGFLTLQEAAVKFDVGVETVRAWIARGLIEFVYFDGNMYIPETKEPQIQKGTY